LAYFEVGSEGIRDEKTDDYRDAKVREWRGFEGKKKNFLCCFLPGYPPLLPEKAGIF
jgi:hypothetical protein